MSPHLPPKKSVSTSIPLLLFEVSLISLVDYADLAIVDLAKAATPEGLQELVGQVQAGMREYGFLYVINHGLTQEQVRSESQKYL